MVQGGRKSEGALLVREARMPQRIAEIGVEFS